MYGKTQSRGPRGRANPCYVSPAELWQLRKAVRMSVELTGFFLVMRQLECALRAPLPDDMVLLAHWLRPACTRQVRRLVEQLLDRGIYVRLDGLLLQAKVVATRNDGRLH